MADTKKKSRRRANTSASGSLDGSETDTSTETITPKTMKMDNKMGPPNVVYPKLTTVARKASAAVDASVVDSSAPTFRANVASSSQKVDDMDTTECMQKQSYVRVPVVFSDVADITAAVALEATEKLNAFIIKEFAGGQAQELNRLTSRVTGMMMRLLMSNIELSGKMKTGSDGTIKVSVAEGGKRSRSIVKKQQQPQQQLARSMSRSTVRAKSRPRPLTFSAVIKGANPLPVATIKTMVTEKITTARVKSVREHKEGELLIETCSAQELEELIRNTNLQEGLVAEKHVPKVVRRLVLEDVSVDVNLNELMVKLYSKNVTAEMMTYEQFSNTTRIVSKPTEARKSLVLEVDEAVQTRWLKQRKVYVDWVSYYVRAFREQALMSCPKCYGFGHSSRGCKMLADLCRRCGESGHHAASCINAVCCRNCKEKNLEANHSVTSMTLCPLYKNYAQLRQQNLNTTYRNAE